MPLLFAFLDKRHGDRHDPGQIINLGEHNQVFFHAYIEEPILAELLSPYTDKFYERIADLPQRERLKNLNNALSLKAEAARLAKLDKLIKQHEEELNKSEEQIKTKKEELSVLSKRLTLDAEHLLKAYSAYLHKEKEIKAKLAKLEAEEIRLQEEEKQLKEKANDLVSRYPDVFKSESNQQEHHALKQKIQEIQKAIIKLEAQIIAYAKHNERQPMHSEVTLSRIFAGIWVGALLGLAGSFLLAVFNLYLLFACLFIGAIAGGIIAFVCNKLYEYTPMDIQPIQNRITSLQAKQKEILDKLNQLALKPSFSFQAKARLEKEYYELKSKIETLQSNGAEQKKLTQLKTWLNEVKLKLIRHNLDYEKFLMSRQDNNLRQQRIKLKQMLGLANKGLQFNLTELLFVDHPSSIVYIIDVNTNEEIWDAKNNKKYHGIENIPNTKTIALDANKLCVIGYLDLATGKLVFNQTEENRNKNLSEEEYAYYQAQCELAKHVVKDTLLDIDRKRHDWLVSEEEREAFTNAKIPKVLTSTEYKPFHIPQGGKSHYKKWINGLRTLRGKSLRWESIVIDRLKDALFFLFSFFVLIPATTIPIYILQGLLLVGLFLTGGVLLYLNLIPVIGWMLVVQGLVLALYRLDRQFDVSYLDINHLMRKIIMSYVALGIILGPALGMGVLLVLPALPFSFIGYLGLGIGAGCVIGIISGLCIGAMINAIDAYTERTLGRVAAGVWVGAMLGLGISVFMPMVNLHWIIASLCIGAVVGSLAGLACDRLMASDGLRTQYNPTIFHNMLLGLWVGSVLGFATGLIIPLPSLNIVMASFLFSTAGAGLGMLSTLIKGAIKAKRDEAYLKPTYQRTGVNIALSKRDGYYTPVFKGEPPSQQTRLSREEKQQARGSLNVFLS